MSLHFLDIDSPLGRLRLVADEQALRGIEFEHPRHPLPRGEDWHARDTGVLRAARAQLGQYFRGERRRFELPLAPQGSEFQRRVWQALLAIEYGRTCSYADIARALGDAQATRAVGAANGRNPIAVIVPCHRVIGADGSLVGFAGGLERKRYLLDHEAKVAGTWDRLF